MFANYVSVQVSSNLTKEGSIESLPVRSLLCVGACVHYTSQWARLLGAVGMGLRVIMRGQSGSLGPFNCSVFGCGNVGC